MNLMAHKLLKKFIDLLRKVVKHMSIQPVSGSYSLWQTMKSDLQTLNQSLTAAQNAQKSGAQDQVTISQDALQKSMAVFQSDISNLQSGAGGAFNNTTAGTSSDSGTKATPLQTLDQDLASLQNAIQSGDKKRIQNAENALGTYLSGIQKGHHHRHHHSAQSLVSSNSTQSGSIVSSLTGATNAVIGTLLSSKA